jgi:hypothetical protein
MRLPGRITQERDSRVTPDRRAILAQVAFLQRVLRDLACQQLFRFLLRDREIVRMRHLRERELAKLLQ